MMHHGVHGSKYQRSYLLPAVVLRSVKNHPPNAQVTIASPYLRVITLLSNYERTSTPNFTILFSPTFPPTLKSCWRLMKRNGNQRMASVSHVPIDHKACDVVKFHGFFQLKTIKQHLLFLPKTCGDQIKMSRSWVKKTSYFKMSVQNLRSSPSMGCFSSNFGLQTPLICIWLIAWTLVENRSPGIQKSLYYDTNPKNALS